MVLNEKDVDGLRKEFNQDQPDILNSPSPNNLATAKANSE
jgi:hypothetical protein